GDHRLTVSHSWADPGVESVPAIATNYSPSAVEQLLQEEPLVLGSNITIPLVASGRVVGGLAFDFTNPLRASPDELVQRLAARRRGFRQCLGAQGNRGRLARERGDEVCDPRVAQQWRRSAGSRRPGYRRQRELDPVRQGAAGGIRRG